LSHARTICSRNICGNVAQGSKVSLWADDQLLYRFDRKGLGLDQAHCTAILKLISLLTSRAAEDCATLELALDITTRDG
jgi:hypothetical protein